MASPSAQQNAPLKQSGTSVPPLPDPPGKRRDFAAKLERFWLRVTEGLALNQLWSQFRQDARTSFRLYRRDFPGGDAREQWKEHGTFDFLQELAWAFLGKLSPPRRVLLLIGMVLLLFPGGGFQFHKGHSDIQVVWGDPHFWGGLCLFILLMLEVADRVVMKRDLEIARDIQSWLLPAAPPIVPGLAIAFATRPANTVAGDFYDIFSRQDESSNEARFLIAVADVAGKSIPAALLMATFQASLKTLSSTRCSLRELAAGMNKYACSNSQGGLRFTTAFIAEYDAISRILTYVNAGHNNPVLLRTSGRVERLSVGGLPLGIQHDGAYATGEVTLTPGDWLVVFTDGLVEAEDELSREYGEDRLLATMGARAGSTPEMLLQQIISDVNTFVGATPRHDDITCVLIKAS